MIPIGVFLAAILLRLAVIVLALDLGTSGLISSIFVLQHPAAEPSHMLTTFYRPGSNPAFLLLGVHAMLPNIRSEDARAGACQSIVSDTSSAWLTPSS